ncbi:hypothetical protein B0H21DRAFT_678671, partial [Amylocystis lapponica]
DVLFIVNAQHNCIDGHCQASGKRYRMQERVESEVIQPFIEHTNNTHYILNMHMLHNAALLRKAIPRHLSQPIPYLQNRRAEHDKMAAALRGTQNTK